jgi:hypothetical protein
MSGYISTGRGDAYRRRRVVWLELAYRRADNKVHACVMVVPRGRRGCFLGS